MTNAAYSTREAARLLGKRGGTATLQKYGKEKLREWGRLGGKFGKRGGRPPKKKEADESNKE